jgi:hypothetical protein
MVSGRQIRSSRKDREVFYMVSHASHQLDPPNRILLGPGPSNIHPRVQMAMLAPIVGHLDPYFVTVMEDTVHLLSVRLIPFVHTAMTGA